VFNFSAGRIELPIVNPPNYNKKWKWPLESLFKSQSRCVQTLQGSCLALRMTAAYNIDSIGVGV